DIETFRKRLRGTVAMARPEYDVVFIDAQAGADDFAREAMDPAVSDTVVLVSEYDPVSAAGVERLKALFPVSLTFSRTWILLNKVLPEYADSFSDFLEIARYLSPIPWSAEVVRAYAAARSRWTSAAAYTRSR